MQGFYISGLVTADGVTQLVQKQIEENLKNDHNVLTGTIISIYMKTDDFHEEGIESGIGGINAVIIKSKIFCHDRVGENDYYYILADLALSSNYDDVFYLAKDVHLVRTEFSNNSEEKFIDVGLMCFSLKDHVPDVLEIFPDIDIGEKIKEFL